MKSLIHFGRRLATPVIALICFGIPASAFGTSPVQLKGGGAIDFSAGGLSSFVLGGTGSHLGRYTSYGEVAFAPGAEEGTFAGEGIAVIEAANGDLLVGVVKWQLDADGPGHVSFSWRDSVEFSDGTIVRSTGRFAESRPPGAALNYIVVRYPTTGLGIIAILIG